MVSAIALTGSAAPALANSSHDTQVKAAPAAATTSVDTSVLSTAASGARAAAAIEQTALDLSLQAQKESSVAAAMKAAAKTKKAADAKAAAVAAAKAKAAKAAEAARERAAAAQAASRSAQRTQLTAVGGSDSSAANSSSGSSGSSASDTSSAASTAGSTATGSAAKLISFLKSQLGKPYVYGAAGPDSYDCSGLTQVAYQTVGVSLPRTSQEQSTVGTPVSVSDVQPGDIIFWGGEGSAYHVGVYIGDGQYLDAANPSTPVAIHQMADYMPDWAVRVL
ncbi:C40 family peptidase [Streptomyces sp. CA-111067]|uniref:C40 family peptidase n=1 Tax=Streptomyces sp. CA-111067 TaxID=3240046 RepID=UPI003D989AF2